MMAAGTASLYGADVTIFESMPFLGKKLAITGKGRCNVTNASGIQELLDNITKNPRFLYSALSTFTPDDAMSMFENLGVPLKTERGNRVYPESDKAKDIVDAYTQVPMHYSNMKRVDLLAIDELGVENVDVKNYGNASEPIIDLLSHRYDKMKVTAISSNLTMKQIEERYGLRLADRFNEMFHKIAFTGKSFRR
jgi:hypothetical protein